MFQEAILLYPQIADICYDSSSEDGESVAEEVRDIVDSLFDLAPTLDELLEKILPFIDLESSLMNPQDGSTVVTFYKGLIFDKFPSASPQLVKRFAEGNEKCHQISRGEVISDTNTDMSNHYPKSHGPSLGLSFIDSGLGSSLKLPELAPPESEFSAYSSTTLQRERPSIPSMPKQDGLTGGLRCLICSRIQKTIVTNRQWK